MMANTADKRVKLLQQIEFNVLDKSRVKNAKLAKEIARKWAKL